MASKIETILTNLDTLLKGLKVGGADAFAEVTQKLRPADTVTLKPAIDFVMDTVSHIGFVDGTPEYEITISYQIVQNSDPDVVIGKRIGDLLKLVTDALWANRTLSQAAKTFKLSPIDSMYSLAEGGGSRIGVAGEIKYTYME